MGRRDDEDGPGGLPLWSAEVVLWLGCLSVAVMPTALGLMAWRAWIGTVTPLAGLVIYVMVFTLMVVAMKPWTVR